MRIRTMEGLVAVICTAIVAAGSVHTDPQLDAAGSQRDAPSSCVVRPLLLSEVAIDKLGADGGWVEIYNRSDQTVNAGGIQVFSSDKELATLPEDILIPARGILVIRWGAAVDSGQISERLTESFSRENAATLLFPPVSTSPKMADSGERSPGECALVGPAGQEQSRCYDYLRWGRQHSVRDSAWAKAAAEAEIWPPHDAVYVGIAPRPGDPPAPKPGVVCRMGFSAEYGFAEREWVLLPISLATPGKGNPVPPPMLHSPSKGDGIASDQDLAISLRPWTTTPLSSVHQDRTTGTAGHDHDTVIGTKGEEDETNPLPYRMQIGADPHFREVVIDRHIARATTIKSGLLPPGKYFVRVRMDIATVSTDWSEATFFTYR